MRFIDRLRMAHRFWRYRLRTERSSISFLLQQRLRGEVVLDVGANLGIYSYWMHKAVGLGGRVIAFEPQPELARHLADLRNAFALTNLEIVNKGVSSSAGQAQLYRPEAGSGAGSLHVRSAGWRSVDVELITLDAWYDDSRPVRFIKCDVEGHEYDVLVGARRILQRDRPPLLLEIHHAQAEKGDLAGYLADLGYRGFFLHGGDQVSFAQFGLFPYRKSWESHRNYVFVHDEAARG